jgi:hypothetical protein
MGLMTIQILSIVLGLCFFILPLWTYRKGLQDGLNIKQDKPIEPIRPNLANNPFYKAKTKVEEDKMMQGLQNIMSYDGNPQKEVKEE